MLKTSSGTYGLFVTDGTTAGTFELGGLKNAGLGTVYFGGLTDTLQFLNGYTVFGNKVFFGGTDSDNFKGVWVSDGTAAGTFELGGLKSGGLSSSGGSFGYSAALGASKVVFQWSDGAGIGANDELWVTNGTSSGTSEIGGHGNKGIAGVNPGLLVQGPLVSFDGKVLFAGADAKDYVGLWVTDGTAGGTDELGGLNSAGIKNASSEDLYPRDITTFGSKAVFEGTDANGHSALWVTNGTASGTAEVGGLGSAGITNAAANFSPSDFTAIGNKVLFDAVDASGQTTLWVTDGTTSGTQEIGGLNNHGVANAPSGGLVGLNTATGQLGQNGVFTSNGTYASFTAYDASGHQGLWVSDGTLAGTHELSGISGAAIPQNFQPGHVVGAIIQPAVTAIAATASAKDLDAGKTATISLAMSEAVTVTGKPTLTLNDGGVASYDAAKSTATKLVFDYTVTPGQNTSALTVTKVTLPAGASITDLAGNALSATLPASATLGLQIDTTAPTVTAVTASPSSGTVATGATVAITAKMSETVTVTGTPTLLLNDGGTATYDAKHSTATSLQFDYAVPKTQGTPSLSVIGVELPSANAIQDGAGNIVQLSGAATKLSVKVNTISTGTASVTITGTQEAEIFSASSQEVTFAPGASGTLKLDAAQSFTGKISGLTAANVLDLANLVDGAHMKASYSGTSTGGTLTVGNGTQSDMIALLGNYQASIFTLSSDGHGGTNVVDPPKLALTPLISANHA